MVVYSKTNACAITDHVGEGGAVLGAHKVLQQLAFPTPQVHHLPHTSILHHSCTAAIIFGEAKRRQQLYQEATEAIGLQRKRILADLLAG